MDTDTLLAPQATNQPNVSQGMAVQLLEDLNLNHIPDDQKKELLVKIAGLLDQEILYAVMSRLEDKDVEDLEQLLSQHGEEDSPFNEHTYAFLASRIQNLPQIIEDALVAVYDRLKETNDILAS